MTSRIAAIVDYTASIAAGIEGVKSVAGAGQDLYNDPLRPGKRIAAAPSDPVEEFSHWSELPTAPAIQYVSQEGTVELSWTIVMKLFFSRGDIARIRQLALPFYDRYLAAFVPDYRLGGLALRTQILSFAVMTAEGQDFVWLETRLLVVERVEYP